MAKIWDPVKLEAEIARLQSLGIAALRAEWGALFKKAPPPSLTKDLLGRMIAYRLQEQTFGGLDRETKRLLANLAAAKTAPDLPQRLKAGTVLVRDYQGTRHEVTIRREGYIWQNGVYSSLSAIAKAITGTSWNGRRFFGVESAQLIASNARRATEAITAPVRRRAALASSSTVAPPFRAAEASKPARLDADARSISDPSLGPAVRHKAKPIRVPQPRAEPVQIIELVP